MSLLKEALASEYCVISTMKTHSGQSVEQIIDNKSNDIKKVGHTFWHIRTDKYTCSTIQKYASKHCTYALFIESKDKSSLQGAANIYEPIKKYQLDGGLFLFPQGLNPVTGKMDKSAKLLVFDQIESCSFKGFSLKSYVDANTGNIIERFYSAWYSAFFKRNKSNFLLGNRIICAVARLSYPYCVIPVH
ncbi:hypothetical protein [Geovibrio ferrireducens]|uniref:hypothetical protein n=1 Tax=Geovibrio ferrireducens TaxID=46201 RepID=UPI0022451DE7|nr:hypothetical protein [Geovibrio ferrireducens]